MGGAVVVVQLGGNPSLGIDVDVVEVGAVDVVELGAVVDVVVVDGVAVDVVVVDPTVGAEVVDRPRSPGSSRRRRSADRSPRSFCSTADASDGWDDSSSLNTTLPASAIRTSRIPIGRAERCRGDGHD